MIKKREELKALDKSDLNAYLGGLELEKIETSRELNKATVKHNKVTKAISEVKAELMNRNSKVQPIKIPGF